MAYIPQVVRIFKLKSAREISLTFTIILFLGIAFWLFYGISIKSLPIILWNGIGEVLVALLLFAKLKYGK